MGNVGRKEGRRWEPDPLQGGKDAEGQMNLRKTQEIAWQRFPQDVKRTRNNLSGLRFRREYFIVNAWPRLNAFHSPLFENILAFLRQSLTL